MKNHLRLGVDLGYGQVKIAGPGEFRRSFPAVVADAGTTSDIAGMLVVGGGRYLVGEAAVADPSHRSPVAANRIDSPDELARYCAALALAVEHYQQAVFAVHTGLPPADWRNEELRRRVANRLQGVFKFEFFGRSYQVLVEEVTVDPQAASAFYDELLDDSGCVRRPELKDLHTLVLDVGHKTTDQAYLQGLKPALGRNSIRTDSRGVWHVYEEAQRLLARPPYDLTLLSAAQVDSIWRAGGLRLAGQWMAIHELEAAAAGPIARAILSDLERSAGDLRRWDVVILCGGGASVLSSHLKFPGQVIQGSEYSNAAGYYKRQLALQQAQQQHGAS